MEKLSKEKYLDLCATAKVLQEDAYGPKVLQLADGQMAKIFRRKSLFSSALLRPYARRFASNAGRLAKRGIHTVRINRLCRCSEPARHLVFYQPVAGVTLRDYLAENPENIDIFEDLAEFLAELHARGIYFRSIHFGNIIVLPESAGFALIDVADLSFRNAPLKYKRRLRNFRHFLRYRVDRKSLHDFGMARFVEIFSRHAGIPERQADLMNFLDNICDQGA